MIEPEPKNWTDIQNVLNHKHILFDTNILINAVTAPTAFYSFFERLRKISCIGVYFSFIEFEFLSEVTKLSELNLRQQLIQSLRLTNLGSSNVQLDEVALSLSQEYRRRGINGPNLIDCLISAYLKRHEKSLLLATNNLSDFPTTHHELIGLYPIDTGKKILSIGLYKSINLTISTKDG